MVIKEKSFEKYLDNESIQSRVKALAEQINNDYKDTKPLFIAVLNGSFMFAADLMKEVTIPCEISFVKVASYEEMESTGNVKQLIGLNENIFKRDVIIVEDIIDTGKTITKILSEFESLGTNSVEVLTLLRKPLSLEIPLKYVGFEIEDDFVLGYGLDYDGLGRNLKDLYKLEG
ncbi:MAG: hypoxanthine phosphoribosyltransferase [Bacteroidota bacterium]